MEQGADFLKNEWRAESVCIADVFCLVVLRIIK